MTELKGNDMSKATATIRDPRAMLFEHVEHIDSIEIGHLLVAIKHLYDMAQQVNEHPSYHCESAQLMAYLIDQIAQGINEADVRRISEKIRAAQEARHAADNG